MIKKYLCSIMTHCRMVLLIQFWSVIITLLTRGQDDQAQKQNDRQSRRGIDHQWPSTRKSTTKWSGQAGRNDFDVFREKASRIDSRKRATLVHPLIQQAQATGLSTLLKRNKWKSSSNKNRSTERPCSIPFAKLHRSFHHWPRQEPWTDILFRRSKVLDIQLK